MCILEELVVLSATLGLLANRVMTNDLDFFFSNLWTITVHTFHTSHHAPNCIHGVTELVLKLLNIERG
eukprot:gene1650-12723_t